MVLGEDNPIHVVVGRVLYFLLNSLDSVVYIVSPMVCDLHESLSSNQLQLDQSCDLQRPESSPGASEQIWMCSLGCSDHLSVCQDHLYRVDGLAKVAVHEGAALSCRPRITPANRDPREFHDDQWDETMFESCLYQFIHGDIGLHGCRFGGLIDSDHI